MGGTGSGKVFGLEGEGDLVEQRSFPPEVQVMLMNLVRSLEGDDHEAAVRSLIQIGVVDPAACGCNLEMLERGEEDATYWRWIHSNHRLVNVTVWQLLAGKPGSIGHIRRMLSDDLQVVRKTNEDYRREYIELVGNDEGFVGPGDEGEFAFHSYTQSLLDNFLWPSSDNVRWF